MICYPKIITKPNLASVESLLESGKLLPLSDVRNTLDELKYGLLRFKYFEYQQQEITGVDVIRVTQLRNALLNFHTLIVKGKEDLLEHVNNEFG